MGPKGGEQYLDGHDDDGADGEQGGAEFVALVGKVGGGVGSVA